MNMREHARYQAGVLLRRLAYQVSRAARRDDAESIHDLRISIRRFAECLRVFDEFFAAKRIRKRLKRMMDRAAAVRDRDVAIALLAEAGLKDGEAAAMLRKERRAARREFDQGVQRWLRRDLSRKWREELEL
jgi:CHAD domain-containing protein